MRIEKDIALVFHNNPFFGSDEIKAYICDVLLFWTQKYSDIGYHSELCWIVGVIIYVVYSERAQNNLGVDKNAEDCLKILNNKSETESDSFQILEKIMLTGLIQYFQNRKTDEEREEIPAYLKIRCNRIYNSFLKIVDPKLYAYLKSKDVNFESILS